MVNDYLAKETSIFLCGGATKKQSQFRFSLGKKIENNKSKYAYSIYYPETLFSEILLGHNKSDLLSLENFLADSVNAVVIPLQSVGTFTELGAFANHPRLKDKLIVLIDPKFKLDNSFINSGPIKFLKNKSTSIVMYSKFSGFHNMVKLSYRITIAARKIKAQNPLKPTIENPLISKLFYMSLIYIFDPIKIELFKGIIEYLIPKDENYAIRDTILSTILKEKNIKLIYNDLISFNESGFKLYLRNIGFTENDVKGLLSELSKYRITAINFYYRKEGINYRGKVYKP